jgi:glucose-1-phosphate cytidylyltransferase
MRTVILAGGKGTRIQEETVTKPKPMIEIGGRPLLRHVMDIYCSHGFKEFVVALGYKGDVIKQYFLAHHYLSSNLTVRSADARVEVFPTTHEDWVVHLVDTGSRAETGGRLKRLGRWIGRERFMMAYGDGVANLNVTSLVDFHARHGRLATLTAVRPSPRFGHVNLEGDHVTRFAEKPPDVEDWINGGFFVLEPEVLDYIDGDHEPFERGPLERLAADDQLVAYRHEGFWHCVDTAKDMRVLESLFESGELPWRSAPGERAAALATSTVLPSPHATTAPR